jgi:hypothetical protein
VSIFKKIKGSIKDEYLLNGLVEHLRKIGIEATVLVSEPKVQAFTNFIGSVSVEGKNIDLVEVEMKLVGGGFDSGEFHGDIGYSTSVYRFNYVVQAEIDGLENKLKAETKPIKKGFLSKEVVGLKWEGGSLAQLLNGDNNLRDTLLREGLFEIGIRTDKKNRCVRIRQKTFHSKTELDFPTLEVFEIYNKIAEHTRSLTNDLS